MEAENVICSVLMEKNQSVSERYFFEYSSEKRIYQKALCKTRFISMYEES